ncbi:hypothetical protein SAY86_021125 [Trapa natans]|uniref:Zinc-ribbon domain-containing protein n=1 Tax=Trapa natans TaxID=22666 RepID=A0AAN7M1L6_TRANT|nr:hypothetical protein SAY86_021125 [Trapa natans]
MTSHMTPHVRLVKCPKCEKVLPEFPDVPVYRCGGCDTILQAKNRHKNARIVRSDLQEATKYPKDEMVQGFEEGKGSSDLDKEMVIPSSEEQSMDKGNVKDPGIFMNYDQGLSSGTCCGFSNSNEESHEAPMVRGPLPVLVEKVSKDVQTNGEVSSITKALPQEDTKDGSLNEGQEKLQMCVSHEHKMSEETFTSTEFLDPCSEFSGTIIGDSHRSLAAIPGYHLSYDENVSSFDTPVDHFNDRERSRGKQISGKDEQRFGLSNKRLGKSRLISDEILETSRSRFHGKDEMARGRNNELPPRIPANRRKTEFTYEDEGSPSQGEDNLLPYSSNYHLSQSPEEFVAEDNNVRLLQLVHELEDQLKKSCNFKRIDGRNNRAAYYSHELLEEEGLMMDLIFPRGNPWARNFGSSTTPFSAEITRSAHQPEYSLRDQFPQARQHSEPLPPPFFHSKSIRSTGRRHLCGPYSSWPSSPQQQYMGSDSSVQSSDLNELQKLRKYYQDKEDHLLKRHLRPIHGAAPFMTCYHCWEVLQVPEDSFVSRRRFHLVKCGSCLIVLKFTLENGTCIAPYEPDARAPPPSEAGEYENSMGTMMLYPAADAAEINEEKYLQMDPRDMRTSPLHRLMGYSSVSQVFKR